MDGARQLHPDELLEHMGFVRNLARALTSDASLADDVAQDVMVDVLQKTPGVRSRSLRSWLYGVVRNKVHQHYRSETRRSVRQERAAQGFAERDARQGEYHEEVLQRAELRQQVVDGVLRLPEPYRLMVLLRYMEELSAREISERLQLPLNTVRTRLNRGLEKLRQMLDREHEGDRRAWLVPLVALSESPFPSTPGSMTIGTAKAASGLSRLGSTGTGKTWGVLVFLVLGSLLWVGVSRMGLGDASEDELLSASRDPAAESSSTTPPRTESASFSFEKDQQVGQDSSTTGVPSAAESRLEVTVLDEQEQLVVGAKVEFLGSGPRPSASLEAVTTDTEGRAELTGGLRGAVTVSHPDYVTRRVSIAAEDEILRVVLDTGFAARFYVVDLESEQPLADAQVFVQPLNEANGDSEPIYHARTDLQGHCTIRLPLAQPCQLLISAAGYLDEATKHLELTSDREIEVALRPGASLQLVRGSRFRGDPFRLAAVGPAGVQFAWMAAQQPELKMHGIVSGEGLVIALAEPNADEPRGVVPFVVGWQDILRYTGRVQAWRVVVDTELEPIELFGTVAETWSVRVVPPEDELRVLLREQRGGPLVAIANPEREGHAFDWLGGGRYWLEVWGPSGVRASRAVTLERGMDDLVIDLEARSRLVVTAGKKSATGVLLSDSGPAWFHSFDPDETLSFADLPHGAYRLWIVAGAVVGYRDLGIRESEQRLSVAEVLEQQTRYALRVLPPMADTHIRYRLVLGSGSDKGVEPGPWQQRFPVAAAGLELEVPRGTYRLALGYEDEAGEWRELEVQNVDVLAPMVASFHTLPPPPRTLRLWSQGRALPGIAVTFLARGKDGVLTKGPSLWTDAHGRVTFRLVPGEYLVRSLDGAEGTLSFEPEDDFLELELTGRQ